MIMKDGFSGQIYRNGIVESDLGRAAYTGPEFADLVSERKSWVAVIVDGAAKDLFPQGQLVRFYQKSDVPDAN